MHDTCGPAPEATELDVSEDLPQGDRVPVVLPRAKEWTRSRNVPRDVLSTLPDPRALVVTAAAPLPPATRCDSEAAARQPQLSQEIVRPAF